MLSRKEIRRRLNVQFDDILGLNKKLREETEANKEFRDNLVTCDVCGCLIDKKMAVEGEHYVKTIQVPNMGFDYATRATRQIGIKTKEVVGIRWYCKVHDPNRPEDGPVRRLAKESK